MFLERNISHKEKQLLKAIQIEVNHSHKEEQNNSFKIKSIIIHYAFKQIK